MNKHEIIKELVLLSKERDGSYFDVVKAIALIFPKNLVEQLQQLVKGPIWDGDIICKSNRGVLFEMGIAVRVCSNNEQGYTASKYIGYSILRALKEKVN